MPIVFTSIRRSATATAFCLSFFFNSIQNIFFVIISYKVIRFGTDLGLIIHMYLYTSPRLYLKHIFYVISWFWFWDLVWFRQLRGLTSSHGYLSYMYPETVQLSAAFFILWVCVLPRKLNAWLLRHFHGRAQIQIWFTLRLETFWQV